MVTVSEQGAGNGATSLPELPAGGPRRRGAPGRAESIAIAPPASPAAPGHSPPQADRARARLLAAAGRLRLWRPQPLHTPPPSLAGAWARHREHAGHWHNRLIRAARMAFAGPAWVKKAALYAMDWATDSPGVLAATIVVAYFVWHWL